MAALHAESPRRQRWAGRTGWQPRLQPQRLRWVQRGLRTKLDLQAAWRQRPPWTLGGKGKSRGLRISRTWTAALHGGGGLDGHGPTKETEQTSRSGGQWGWRGAKQARRRWMLCQLAASSAAATQPTGCRAGVGALVEVAACRRSVSAAGHKASSGMAPESSRGTRTGRRKRPSRCRPTCTPSGTCWPVLTATAAVTPSAAPAPVLRRARTVTPTHTRIHPLVAARLLPRGAPAAVRSPAQTGRPAHREGSQAATKGAPCMASHTRARAALWVSRPPRLQRGVPRAAAAAPAAAYCGRRLSRSRSPRRRATGAAAGRTRRSRRRYAAAAVHAAVVAAPVLPVAVLRGPGAALLLGGLLSALSLPTCARRTPRCVTAQGARATAPQILPHLLALLPASHQSPSRPYPHFWPT